MIPRSERALLYKACLEAWGWRAQMTMAVEEMAELTDLLAKTLRGRLDPALDSKDAAKVASEVADVFVMMEQLEDLLPERLVRHMMASKIQRLMDRADKAGEYNKFKTIINVPRAPRGHFPIIVMPSRKEVGHGVVKETAKTVCGRNLTVVDNNPITLEQMRHKMRVDRGDKFLNEVDMANRPYRMCLNCMRNDKFRAFIEKQGYIVGERGTVFWRGK